MTGSDPQRIAHDSDIELNTIRHEPQNSGGGHRRSNFGLRHFQRRYTRLSEGSSSAIDQAISSSSDGLRSRSPSSDPGTISQSNQLSPSRDHRVDDQSNPVGWSSATATATSGLSLGLAIPPHASWSTHDDRKWDEDEEYVAQHNNDNAAPNVVNENDTVPLTRDHPWGNNGSINMRSSHLGANLPHIDGRWRDGHGRSSPTRSARDRSVSPASTLNRAGTIMRNMSQRVVNLGNEREVLEQVNRRKSALHGANLFNQRPSSRRSHDIEQPLSPSKRESAISTHKGVDFPDLPESEGEPEAIKSPEPSSPTPWKRQWTPLKGKTFGIFSPENKLRLALCELLIHPVTEPLILALIVVQTVLLAVQGSVKSPSSVGFDIVFLLLFIIYTLEIIAKSIVSGFIFNAKAYSTLDKSEGTWHAVSEKLKNFLMPQSRNPPRNETAATSNDIHSSPDPSNVTIMKSFTNFQSSDAAPSDFKQQQRIRLARRAFLRHSFNRLDFVAVVSYWLSLIFTMSSIKATDHTHIFKMLSCLRILRLLLITEGTSVILLSLKKAAPLLLNISFLMGFFWLIFAIIGVQSFKSSLRRTCTWVNPTGGENYTMNDASGTIQFCGGYLDPITGHKRAWLRADGRTGDTNAKGYICPQGSVCIEGSNPYSGTVSFDNIFQSLELVFVIMSSNTFTDILYYTADSDYLAASLFFIVSYIFLALWLVNLLVAVITSSFQVLREETKHSAFTSYGRENENEQSSRPVTPQKTPVLLRVYDYTYYVWMVIIAFDLIVQCLMHANMSDKLANFIDTTEIVVTLILLFEIMFRLVADFRNFHRNWRNWVDLFLAVITTIILIPPIKNNTRVYHGMAIFQILRVYRIVLAFSVTRDLILTVFTNAYGLINLIVFVFLFTFLASVFASQLFRTALEGSEDLDVTFSDIYNSFLGMYQIFSSENWTTILYSAVEATEDWNAGWISAIFIIMWFILANFVVLNMFIAVIQESFDISNDQKRIQQMKAFVKHNQTVANNQTNISLAGMFGMGRQKDYHDLDHSGVFHELVKRAVVDEFISHDGEQPPVLECATDLDQNKGRRRGSGLITNTYKQIQRRLWDGEPNPFWDVPKTNDDLDPSDMVKSFITQSQERKKAQRDYLKKYPTYNVSLFIFKPDNPIRLLCQKIAGPARGTKRIEGSEPYRPVWYTFSAFIYAAIVAMVLIACIVTPLYQLQYYEKHGFNSRGWFVYTDIAFAVIFTVEVIIKVIADGFFWTPHAYFHGSWGLIDGFVLITMWIAVVTSLNHITGASRVVGAFRALRALRLLNVSDSARETFDYVLLRGWWKVLSAALVSLSFLLPFALYGLKLFNGQLEECNDSNFGFSSLDHCVGEYNSQPFNWDVLAPRSVSNPYYDFDNFAHSLFILFQIVSQEGWIDVLYNVMSITAPGHQPEENASKAKGLFFVFFNLLGAVFVLTLFVSVFMRNYTEQTGVAFLTSEQRSWLELRKLLRQVSPSKLYIPTNTDWFSRWCYKICSRRNSWWSRFITILLLFHLGLLMTEFYPEPIWWDRTRTGIFLVLDIIYLLNIIVRIIGRSWRRFFGNSWDIYSLLSVTGSFLTILVRLAWAQNNVIESLQKLFLVSVILLLIPRNTQLDQLFKTAVVSLPAIASLLATWLILFLVYAIALTQVFGLTKFGESETNNINFRDVPRALVVLFRMSAGEGWNELMEDFAQMEPPYCMDNLDFYDTDCGSKAWARFLFSSWNIISMYIFVSLFVSLIFESFSYVYQQSDGLYAVSRGELRHFKDTWAKFDPAGTGFIPKEQFPRFLRLLEEPWKMRIYDGQYTVHSILSDCKVSATRPTKKIIGPVVENIDLGRLNARLDDIPRWQIKKNKNKLDPFFEEIMLSANQWGVPFGSCLRIIAHYNIISDHKSLRLEEWLRRRIRLQRVEATIRVRKLQMLVLSLGQRFRYKQQLRELHGDTTSAPPTPVRFEVPEIFVNEGRPDPDQSDDNDPGTPMLSTFQRGSLQHDTVGDGAQMLPRINTNVATHVTQPPRSLSIRSPHSASPTLSPNYSPSRQAWSRDMPSREQSPFSPGRQNHSDSPVDASGNMNFRMQEMFNSLDQSAWGESIRRSNTMRDNGRSPSRSRSRSKSRSRSRSPRVNSPNS